MHIKDLVNGLADIEKQLNEANAELAWATQELHTLQARAKTANNAIERAAASFEEFVGGGQAYVTIPANNIARIARLIRDIKIPV